jgi:hypothetical protein
MHFRTLILSSAAVVCLSAPSLAQTPDDTYQQQMQQYQQQQQDYQDKQQNYERQRDQYEYDRSHPDSWWRSAYYHAAPDWYYHDADSSLVGANVDERDGLRIGQIGAVERSPGGRIERIEILLRHDRVSWVEVDRIRFDHSDRIAFIDVSPDEIYANSHYDYRP